MLRPMLFLAATVTLLRLALHPVPVLADHEVTVADGDSLAVIAVMWYGDAEYAQQIARYNHLADAGHLATGQVLKLPDISGSPEALVSVAAGVAAARDADSGATGGTAPSRPHVAPVIQMGLATWYGPDFEGQITKCGQVFHQTDYTASSNDLPCGTVIQVTNVQDGRRVTVTVDDTGGFRHPTILDLSPAAFSALASLDAGVLRVGVSGVILRDVVGLMLPESFQPSR